MRAEPIDLSLFSWMNPPERAECAGGTVEFTTSPNTDFWKRTHYGFERTSGHAFMARLWDDFSFSAHAEFFYESLYDQCGLILYADENNWAKASIEYIDETCSQLGSVVTVNGWSDWAMSPIDTACSRMTYRLSRRGDDFRFECSRDGGGFAQMRIFHMHTDLSAAMAGVYACSPSDSTFQVRFTNFLGSPSVWRE